MTDESKSITVRDNSPAPAYLEAGAKTHAGAGLENVRMQDIEVPRVSLMQALSPEVADEGKFRAGDLVDSINGTLIAESGKEVKFIVLRHVLQWIKWRPRPQGGGIVEMSMDANSALAKAYKDQDPKLDAKTNDVIVEYHNFIVILPDYNPEQMMMIACGKTNWKHGKNLISRMKMRGSRFPAFAGVYTVKSDNETNKNNQTYKVFNFENAGWADEPLYRIAEKAYDAIRGVAVAAKVDDKESDANSGEFKETTM